MISAIDLRVGMIIIYEGELYRVTYIHHLTPGNKRGSIQTKLRNLRTGIHFEQRFRSEIRLEKASLEQHDMEYLYAEGGHYYFMNTETYEQTMLPEDLVREVVQFLKSNQRVTINFYDGASVGIDLPLTVDLRVIETDPGMKKATISASTKPANLETGLTVQVPQFVKEGDVIRVDTSSGEYLERA